MGAAGFALLSGGQWREVRAEITLDSRTSSAFADGRLVAGVAIFPQPPNVVNSYDVADHAPIGFGPFTIRASPPDGTTTLEGASATSDGQVNGTTTLDIVEDTLFVSSRVSTSAAVSALKHPRDSPMQMRPQPGFLGLLFHADSLYEYEFTIDALSAGAQANPARSGAAEARILLRKQGGAGLGNVFVRSKFFPFLNQKGTAGPDVGSLVGTLGPGDYLLDFGATADINHFAGTSATADSEFTLQLTPIIVRWDKTNPSSGVFQTGGNWSDGAPPSGDDHGVINQPGTYTVSLDGNAAHKRLDVKGDGANVTLDLDGHRYTLDELNLGDPSGNFTFTLKDSSGVVAVPPGDSGPWPAPGSGELRFAIVKAKKPGRSEITARYAGPGQIDNGHTINVSGDGHWTVSELTVGDAGTLNVSGGGTVVSNFPVVGKQVPGARSGPGKVVVSGGGGLVSTFKAIDLKVGDDGRGELEIKAGGEVTAGSMVVGKLSNGIGVVTVDGATAILRQDNSSFDLVIGGEGKGTLNVKNGGQVDAEGIFRIGRGEVNVSGGSSIFPKNLNVGSSLLGEGTLSVVDNGRVFVGHRMVIGPKGKVTASRDGGLRVHSDGPTNWVLTVNGELRVDTTGSAFVGDSSGPIPLGKLTIGPGGTLKGNGKIFADLKLDGGDSEFPFGSIFAPANSTGTLTIEGNVVQAPGSVMEIEIGGTDAGQFDVLAVTGDITLGGDVFLKFTDGFAPRQGDQIEFLDVSGAQAGAFAKVELRNLAPGFQFDLRPDGGGMTMVALNDGVFMLPESSAWNVNADGNWSSVSSWTLGDPNHAGATAVFGGKITAPRTVTVDAPITVGRIEFDNANSYTIDGDETLTLDATTGAAQINVTSGSHTISAPVSLADNTVITVSPAAANLSLTGALSASGVNVTKAGVGRLTLTNLRAAGLSIDAGAVAMTPSGTAAATSVLGALTIAGGATPTAKFDVNNNAAIINYTGTSPGATVRQQILAGRGGPGLGATWTGQGITSSAVATINATEAESRSVGFAENSAMPLGPLSTFHGQPVDDTSILIAFTRTGDANLDGVVNDDDVTILGAFYAPGVANANWAEGDFDYNGFVDDDDVTLLGAFYDPSAAPLIAPVPSGTAAVAAVPEPDALLLAILAVAGLAAFICRRPAA